MTNFTASVNQEFTDETISVIVEKMPNLRLFLFDSTQVTDAGFSKLPHLRAVRVKKTEVSDGAIEALKEQLPKCKVTK